MPTWWVPADRSAPARPACRPGDPLSRSLAGGGRGWTYGLRVRCTGADSARGSPARATSWGRAHGGTNTRLARRAGSGESLVGRGRLPQQRPGRPGDGGGDEELQSDRSPAGPPRWRRGRDPGRRGRRLRRGTPRRGVPLGGWLRPRRRYHRRWLLPSRGPTGLRLGAGARRGGPLDPPGLALARPPACRHGLGRGAPGPGRLLGVRSLPAAAPCRLPLGRARLRARWGLAAGRLGACRAPGQHGLGRGRLQSPR